MFTKSAMHGFTVILIYIDDIVLDRDNIDEINAKKQLLDDKIKIKDLRPFKFFLIMEVAWSHHGISLYQRKYTLDLLANTDLLGANQFHPNGLYSKVI